MTSRGALGLLLLLALAACNNSGGGSAVTLPPSSPASYKIGEAQNYTVIAGDTIDSVAQQFNMPVEALIAANHLVSPYALHAGQTLFIPGRGAPGVGTGYVVVAGDTLTRIARHHGTTVAALAALNGLVPPYVIKVGQRLTLPGGSPTQTAAVAGAAPAAAGEMVQFPPAEPAEPVPAAGSVKVATEALSAPSGASTTPATQASEPTASQNAAAPPPVLLQPTKPTASKTTAPAVTSEPAANEPAANGSDTPAVANPAAPAAAGTLASNSAGTPAAAAPATAPATTAPSTSAPLVPPPQQPAEVAPPAPRGSGKFLWPVNGKVVSVFGLKDGGQHNDGINIAAPLGTPVRAAENGVVVYAGNELRGFGNLLLIRHADGWVSAYAHCDALLVKRGDQVKRGQVIARVGQTGAVSSPQLHFELRKSGQAVDPTAELGPQGA